MREVSLIQFTEVDDVEYGYVPEMLQVYKVNDLQDVYYVTMEDDEGNDYDEEYNAIEIFVVENRLSLPRRRKVVTQGATINYNLITIEMDDDCPLFRR